MGNITALGNAPGANPAIETYSYDPLYRLLGLKDAQGQAIETYTYNKTGDRLSKASNGLATGTYGYQAGTHWLTSIGSSARTYDANGNTTGNGTGGDTFGYGYNDRNRMTVVQHNGQTVANYTYNAMGQRVAKAAAVNQRFAYDEGSQLLGEYGMTNRNYVWLDNLPVAVVDTSGASGTVHYVHADALGTPRAVTDGTGSAMWQWGYQGNPFGEATTTASGASLNLRFPGQYFDAESGLYQNLNRDFDPTIGRYMRSDPLRLGGGLNTYAYVHSRPYGSIDPLGLANLYIWKGYDGDWGHAALMLDDNTYISWWPQPTDREYPLGSWLDSYFEVDAIAGNTFDHDNSSREGEGRRPTTTIHLDTLDEDAIRDWWAKFSKSHKYNSVSQNCSTTVMDALRAGGSGKHLIGYPSPLIWDPEDVLEYGRALHEVGQGSRDFTAPSQMWP